MCMLRDMSRPHPITADAFTGMLGPDAEPVLDKPGVAALADGRMVKSFRQGGGWFSSARWRPYALRFARAADELARRGVASVQVQTVYRVSPPRRDVVVCVPLPGRPVREVLDGAGMLSQVARFLAFLHERGVHPRSMHLGNVIVDERGGMGVIDVTAARFYRGEVPPAARARDFRTLLRYEPEASAIKAWGVGRFVEAYLEGAKLSASGRRRLLRRLARQHEALAGALSVAGGVPWSWRVRSPRPRTCGLDPERYVPGRR